MGLRTRRYQRRIDGTTLDDVTGRRLRYRSAPFSMGFFPWLAVPYLERLGRYEALELALAWEERPGLDNWASYRLELAIRVVGCQRYGNHAVHSTRT